MQPKTARKRAPASGLSHLRRGAVVEISGGQETKKQQIGKLVEVQTDESSNTWTKLVTDQGHELSSEDHAVIFTTPDRIVVIQFQQISEELRT
ncbi:MAG: hypothetical protein ACHQX1_01590 [Candidatus Micrarchaeales archaeon]